MSSSPMVRCLPTVPASRWPDGVAWDLWQRDALGYVRKNCRRVFEGEMGFGCVLRRRFKDWFRFILHVMNSVTACNTRGSVFV